MLTRTQIDTFISALATRQAKAGRRPGTEGPPAGVSRAVVLDNGSGMMRVGFAGDDNPRDSLRLPIGRATDAGAIETVRNELSRALRIAPEEHSLLLIEPPGWSKTTREKASSLLFVGLKAPRAFMLPAAVPALVASRRITGIVLDLDDGAARVVPIYEGYCLPHAVRTVVLDNEGIYEAVSDAVEKSPAAMRKALANNVVVHGKPEQFPGIDDRMEKERATLAPGSMTLEIADRVDRDRASFAAAAFLAALPGFERRWITKDEYLEAGARIVHS